MGFHPKFPENSLRIHSAPTLTMHIKIQSRPATTDKQWETKGKSITSLKLKNMVTIQIPANVDETMSIIGYEFGIEAIVDTFNRAFKEWQTNHIYLTELVMVLNHKIWQWYEKNDTIARVYDKLWRKADEWAQENLHGKELQYFYEVTD